MPVIPASPKNKAYNDQPNAASTPTLISVSIVAAPCRRFAHAAAWNGHAPHTTTGAARIRDSHCQLSNCNGATIASSSTGAVSTAETSSRRRSEATLPSSGPASSVSFAGGGSSAAVYPVASMAPIASSTVVSAGSTTCARSMA